MEKELSKLAASAIKQLKNENKSLEEGLALYKQASKMAFGLFAKGLIAAEDIESNLEKFLEKEPEELEVMEKAASYRDANASLLFGKISDKPADDGTLDPLTRMLIEDL
jgi:hypothetical protein